MASAIAQDKFWTDRAIYEEAEKIYHEKQALPASCPKSNSENVTPDTASMSLIEKKYLEFEKVINNIQEQMMKMDQRLRAIESKCGDSKSCAKSCAIDMKKIDTKTTTDDDDVDLFASDSEDEEAEKVKQQRLEEYHAKKSKKPALIAKSSIVLDVKPWDDETDMKVMEQNVRKIEMEGLLWGASKLVPLAYGIKKLQISCVVEDEKVSVDLLQEQIEGLEDYVQSVDIAAFNKI
ncbi:elongation factor 1-beta-like isoform X2 [Onthophagus taurus]|uniref:elongation factor 1-beta-like isoform X2 n=1 Tax=Onthophagus taurus TaxID=166361 RepID=UPI000C2053F2|nr:elongation factor 1-beta-like isoform X2 [Onthophagus taurus]